MNLYYLQKSDSRTIIDDKKHLNFEVQDQTVADCWIRAKQNFGYPLTTKQEINLDKRDQHVD